MGVRVKQASLESKAHLFFSNQSIGSLFNDIIEKARANANVTVFNGPAYVRSSYLMRLISWALYTIKLSIHVILFSDRYDHLLIVSNPPFAPLISCLSRKPYSLLIYDLYPEALDQIKLPNCLKSLVYNLWKLTNSYVYPKASKVFIISEPMAFQLKQYYRSHEEWNNSVTVISPWCDTSRFYPSHKLSKEYRSDRKLLDSQLFITYSGNMGITHPIEEFISACSLYVDSNIKRHQSFKALLIGFGAKYKSLFNQAKEAGLLDKYVEFSPPLNSFDLNACLCASDLALIALDGPASHVSLPSKTFTALASGTPLLVIATEYSALAKLVVVHKCGFVVEPGPNAPREICEIISNVSNSRDDLQLLSNNALLASRFFTIDNANPLINHLLSSY